MQIIDIKNFFIKNRIKIVITVQIAIIACLGLFLINQTYKTKLAKEDIAALKEEMEKQKTNHANEIAALKLQIDPWKKDGMFLPETSEYYKFMEPRGELYNYLLENTKNLKTKENIILGGFFHYSAFFYDLDDDGINELIGTPKYDGYTNNHLYILKKTNDKYVDISSVKASPCLFMRFDEPCCQGQKKFKSIICTNASSDKKYIYYKPNKKRYE